MAQNNSDMIKYDKWIVALEEYQFFKIKQFEEYQILEANRVGMDKNLKNIIRQTANAVGLSMPKLYKDPNDKEDDLEENVTN